MTSVEAAQDTLRRLVAERRQDHLTYVADAVGDFALDRASLYYVFDAYGNKFLDLSAGEGVMVIGHGNPEVTSAVYNHLGHHVHTARSGMHVSPRVTEYAKAISQSFGFAADGQARQVLFCTSEVEARMQAVALAKAVTGRRIAVTLDRQFAAPGAENWRLVEGSQLANGWEPVAALYLALQNSDMSVIDGTWARMLTETAERHGAVTIVDETATGYGRTGSLWMSEQWGLDGDVTVLGGAGGGGFPFGAVVAAPDLWAAYRPPQRPQRLFGGSSVVCQAGLVTLQYLEPALLEHVADVGRVLTDSIRELRGQFPDLVVGACGIGLAQGLILSTSEIAAKFYQDLLAHGVLVRPPVNERVIPITPPLVIAEAELRQAVDAMASVCMDWDEPL